MIDAVVMQDYIRDANPIPQLDDLDADELARFVAATRTKRAAAMQSRIEIPTPPVPAPTPPPQRRIWAFALAFVVVLAGVGVAALLVESDSPPDVADTSITAVDETTARSSGMPFDPAVHDLCAWFSAEEIDAIVKASYRDREAEPPPGTFASEGHELGGIGCTWYSEVDGARLFGEEFSLLAMEFQDPGALVLSPYGSRVTGAPDEQPIEYTPYGWDGRVRIGNLSRGVWRYIQGVHASFTVDGHIEVVEFLHWAPDHPTGPINPIGLAIADEMLRRIGWVEGESRTEGGSSSSGDSKSPEAVVTSYLDAYNARDLDAIEAVLDPDVVMSTDATGIGIAEGSIRNKVGRNHVLQDIELWWAQDYSKSYEVVSTEGHTVVVDETIWRPEATYTTRTVTYLVSDRDVIVSIRQIVKK